MAQASRPLSFTMRVVHRYLGFFLAGIMAVYAISGMVLIFRNTDFLKQTVVAERTIQTGLDNEMLGKVARLKEFTPDSTRGAVVYFPGGSYDADDGTFVETRKQLPYVLNKMTDLHKSSTKDALYVFNLFFGAALLFFVISAFWMYMPGGPILRKGLWFAAGGLLLTLLLLFV